MATEAKDKKKSPDKKPRRSLIKSVISELKKVVWPDKEKTRKNILAVLLIILGTALLIFIFDGLANLLLRTTGFYNIRPTSPQLTVSESAETSSADTLATVVESGESAAADTVENNADTAESSAGTAENSAESSTVAAETSSEG